MTLQFHPRLRRPMLVAALALLVAACGKDVVIKQDAAEVSEATEAAVTGARAFYTKLDNARRDYFLVVMASDPNCGLAWTNTVLIEDAGRPHGWRCLADSEKTAYQSYIGCVGAQSEAVCLGEPRYRPFAHATLVSIGEVERSSALGLVNVMADYQTLLAKIVADPKLDTKDQLTALQDRANGLLKIATTLGAGAVAPLDFSKQIEGLSALVDLIRQSAENHRDVARLRELLSGPGSSGARFEAALQGLILRYESLDRNLLRGFDRAQLATRLNQYNSEQAKLSEEARLKRTRALADEYVAMSRAESVPDALAQAFRGLLEHQVRLREAVVDDKFSDADRKRIAAESLGQLKVWFNAISGFVKLF